MDKRVVEELIEARKAVKRKFEALKADSVQAELELHQKFKPIAQPLKELLSNIKTENVQPKIEPSVRTQSPKKESPQSSKTLHTPKVPKEIINDFSDEPSFLETEVIAQSDPTPTLEQLKHELSIAGTSEAFEQYIDQYEGLAKWYVEDMFRDTENNYDHYYGARFVPELSKFRIGDSDLNFKGEDIVITLPTNEEIQYTGTPGLYELLFRRIPDKFKESDRMTYKEIVENTNAARRNYDPSEQIQGTGRKYSAIIKPLLFPKPPKPASTRARTASVTKQGKGIQILKFNNKRVEFVPWKDPNKLVDWLRILLSSKSAGHTGHNNEIIYIIDELRASKIIK